MVVKQGKGCCGEMVVSVMAGAVLLAVIAGMLAALDMFLIQSLARAMTLY